MKQDKFTTGMYIVDNNFKIVNFNNALMEAYPEIRIGDYCYKSLALRDEQCDSCPLKEDNALFYNPIRKEWIYANAAEMDFPGRGTCYCIQFQIRQKIADAGNEQFQEENMDIHIAELSGGTLDVPVIGGYCDLGSPLSYVNQQMLHLLGYETVEEFSWDIDGLVSNTIHPDDLERVTADLTKCAQYGGTFETTYRIRRKNHSWLWIVSSGKRVETKSGVFALLCVVSEMSEFMKRQDEINKQNEILVRKELTSKAVLERMPGGYHRCSPEDGWPFLYFGKSFEAITGWSKEEIINDFDNLFINMVYEEDIPLCANIVENVQKNGYSNAIYRLKKKGGGYRWVSDSTMKVSIGEEMFYHGVLADVSRQVEAMESAKKEAESSNLAKSTFLFNASHDIRTPMNAIQGFAYIIEQNTDNSDVVKDAVKKIIQSGDTLKTLLNDILDLSRIEHGKDSVDRQPLNMNEHVTNLWEMFAGEMQQAGIDFLMENDIKHPDVLRDNLKLTRIAMNLLSNAKKFTPAGGSVTFGVKEENYKGHTADYKLYVKDTGIGMSEEFQNRAFERFERERSSTESGITGSGLGLAIIKRFSDIMGGKCSIDSHIGKGTCITVTVPMLISDSSIYNSDIALEEIDFSGKRVLLVEDNDFNREIARYLLEDKGFIVEQAVNGVECIDKINNSKAGYYDVILMDIQMPVMDGYTATVEIRRIEDSAKASVPIVAMTANAFEEDRKKSIETGMNGHIAKPIDMKVIISVLKDLIK